MSQKFYSAKTPGVRFRKHSRRKVGKVQDRYWVIRYRHAGKAYQEALGWTSQGWSEAKASAVLAELKENQRLGTPPFTLKDKRQAEIEAQEQAQDTQAQAESELITVGGFWDERYWPSAESIKTWRTADAEKGRYQNWVEPALKDKPLVAVTPDDVELIRLAMTKAKKSPQTIKHVVALIRQIFNLAIRLRVFRGDNPTKGVTVKVNGAERQRFLTREEVDALLKELHRRSLQLYCQATISLYAGLRAGEIFALTWRNLDYENGLIAVLNSKKGSIRHAYMTGPIIDAIQEWEKSQGKIEPDQLMFPNRDGGQIKEINDTFWRAVDAVKLNEGVTDRRHKVVFHSLRHTFASWLAISGTPIHTIAALMGHSELSMTQRYSHLSPDHKRAAVKALEAFTNGQAGSSIFTRFTIFGNKYNAAKTPNKF